MFTVKIVAGHVVTNLKNNTMEKFNVYVNGKQMDINTCTLKDVIESIFGKTFEDLPEQYSNVTDYLTLPEFDITKTVKEEQLQKFITMLSERIKFAKKHKDDVDMKNIAKTLEVYYKNIPDLIEEMKNMQKACVMIQGYINDIKNLTK